jgi:hypothetical protein
MKIDLYSVYRIKKFGGEITVLHENKTLPEARRIVFGYPGSYHSLVYYQKQ